jgi:peptidoglycan/LPS O-acetylase OafA/YrhL
MPTYPAPIVATREIRHPQPASSGNDLANLDFMRAVAVLLVLFGHLTYFHGLTDFGPLKTTWMGDLGVKMFFVHTSFVLMLSLERQWRNQAPTELFCGFMVRRIFRIYPLSVAVISLVVAFRLPLAQLQPGRFVALPLHSTLVVSNLLLVQSSQHSILGPTWSLPYEMAMYIFLPWLFLVLYPTQSRWRAAALWTLSFLAGLAWLAYVGQRHSNNFLLYVPCFLAGVIAYQLQRTRRRQLPAVLWPGVVIGIVLLFLYKQTLISNPWLKSWAVCLALGAGAPFFAQIPAPWFRVPSHLIAKYSYGIYLTHFFCIWLTFDRLHYVLPRFVKLPFFAAMVTLLSSCFYHLLEEPLTLFGKRVAKRFDRRGVRIDPPETTGETYNVTA